MKKKIILSSVISIVLCLSLIAGATFALFTSEARVNVAVTSGNVKLTAALTGLYTESLGKPMMDGAFELGGQATIDGQTLKVDRMVPGDKVTVTIDVDNDSDVAIQYCVKLIGEGDLFSALEAVATIDGVDYEVTGAESSTAWVEVTPGAAIGDIELSVLMPVDAGNEYQDTSADIAIQVVAVQGNADTLELVKMFEEGGVITSAGVPNSVDGIVDEESGMVVAGVTIGENDITLQDIVINKTVAGEGYAIGMGNDTSSTLTLDEGAVINANNNYGIVNMGGGDIVLNSGSKITANENGSCIMILPYDDVNIYLNDSGLLDPQDNANGIYILSGIDATINLYVKDMAALGEYSSMLVREGAYSDWETPGVNWYVDGELVEDFGAAKNDTAIDEAIKAGVTTIALGSGSYIIPDSAQGETLTFVGNGKDTVIATQDDGSYEGCDYSLDGATATFIGVTINTDSTTYTGYARLDATYEKCTINGTYTLYGDSVFNDCTFNVSGDVYNIWTWGAPTATFNDCTFNSDGKAMLLYGTENTALTMNNCTFNDNGGLTDKKAAIEIGNDYSKSYTLTVNNATVNGYEYNDSSEGIYTASKLWGNKNAMSEENLTVTIDGVEVYGPNAKDIVYIDSAEDMVEFARQVNVIGHSFAGMTVKLMADIDLAGIDWEPIGQTGATEFKGVFDGNGHTISNLSVNSLDEHDGHYSSGLFGWIESHGEGITVKNLTIDGATVSGNHNVAVVAGYIYGTVENVTVKNATVVCVNANDDANGDKAGIIAGYVGEDADIIKCNAIDSSVSAGRDAGQIVGAAREACVVDCTAENVTVTANGTGTGKNVNEAVIGRVLG